MRKLEYDALLRTFDGLKDANAAFNHGCVKGEIMEGQLELCVSIQTDSSTNRMKYTYVNSSKHDS